jgi:hypothetical protein
MDMVGAEAIYLLYEAGIVQGSGDNHACNPSANITRGEVAAILTRMTDESKRVKFSITPSAGLSEADVIGDYVCTGFKDSSGNVTESGGDQFLRLSKDGEGFLFDGGEIYDILWFVEDDYIAVRVTQGYGYNTRASYENGAITMPSGMMDVDYVFEKGRIPDSPAGPTGEIDFYGASMRYRTDLFDFDDDAGIYPLTAKDGSVSIAWSIVRDQKAYTEKVNEIIALENEGLSEIHETEIAGYNAHLHFYSMYNGPGLPYSNFNEVFIDFGSTGSGGIYGIQFEIASEAGGVEALWTPEIETMLNSLRVE